MSRVSRAKVIDQAKVNKVFDHYLSLPLIEELGVSDHECNPPIDRSQKDYMHKFQFLAVCKDLGIPLDDIKPFFLLYSLNAKEVPHFISRQEFVGSMVALGCESIAELKAQAGRFDPDFLETKSRDFANFYNWFFDFNREIRSFTTKTFVRVLKKEEVLDLLPLILSEQRSQHVKDFLNFLANYTPASGPAITTLSKDSWRSFLDFSNSVKSDLSDYSEDMAWPVLFDEFVRWKKSS